MIVLANTTNQEVIVRLTLFREVGEDNNSHEISKAEQAFWADDSEVISLIADGTLMLSLNGVEILDVSKAIDILKGIETRTVNSQQFAFSQKVLPSGNKLFMRVIGVSEEINLEGVVDFVVPFLNCKITGLEIINGSIGDTASFQVLDTASGAISGVPNFQLNQFGNNVNISKDFYRFASPYDADLIQGITLRVLYNTDTTKNVYVNYILHEVV